MIGTLRKHKTWLWALIITAVIITFVFGYNPTGGGSGGKNAETTLGTVNGHRVTPSEYTTAQNEARLRYFVSTGQWPDSPGRQNNFDLEMETYQQLFLKQKIAEFNLTAASSAKGMLAKNILQGSDQGKPMTLAVFGANVLKPRGMSLQDFDRFLTDHLATLQLISLVGASGNLLTPQEARMLYERENTEASAQAAFFSAADHLAEVTNSSDEIGQFYTNQLAAYRLPDRVQVSYVEFPVTNYWNDAITELAKITNFDQQIDMYILERGTNYPPGANNAAEAKVKLRIGALHDIALAKARNAGSEFASVLFTNSDPSFIVTLAREKNFDVKVTEPFDRERGPKEFSLPFEFTRAFALSADEPFDGPIAGENSAYIIARNKLFPSEIPSLESIHAQVVADFKKAKSTGLAREATMTFYAAATNALAAGKSFAQACTDQHVTMVPLPTFALNTPALPEIEKLINLTALKQVVFSVLPGRLNIAATENGGVVVFVNSHLPVNEAKMNADMPRFLQTFRQTRQQQAFQVWFQREFGKVVSENPRLQRPRK